MWMKRFGFGMPTGIEIQEEAAANMPSKEWKQKRYKKLGYKGDTNLSGGLAKVIGAANTNYKWQKRPLLWSIMGKSIRLINEIR